MSKAIPTAQELTEKYLESVRKAVCDHFQITTDQLLMVSRLSDLVRARQIFSYIALHHFNVTLSNIARYLDRNHSTIICGIKTALNRSSTERAYAEDIEACLLAVKREQMGTRPNVIGELTNLVDDLKEKLVLLEQYLVFITEPDADKHLEKSKRKESTKEKKVTVRPITELLKS